MKLNSLQNNEGARIKPKLLGRGAGSGKGKTCGRGHKGQKSRSGVAIKGFEGGQTPIHMRLPKRGFNCPSSQKMKVINFNTINLLVEKKKVKENAVLDLNILKDLGIAAKKDKVKLLGDGELKYKIKFKLSKYSKSALEKIKKTGASLVE
ncbi:MAG: 50S ribosomal protein L15 [Rickettsiales bacterium]|nr:50S ribosomal protein L15 [Rickettsiales bacterium]